MRRLLLFAVTFAAIVVWRANAESPPLTAIETSPEARLNYLAHARMWQVPPVLSPRDIVDGPSGVFPYTFEQATSGAIECSFAKPGKELGGNTQKFVCRTNDGHMRRLKYWDENAEHGNREVFSSVAATRLLWALGFEALPTLPMNVRCVDCPENPMTGTGPVSTRELVAVLQAYPASGPWIVAAQNPASGWSWLELDRAIASLPPGPERTRQRIHFDALTLIGVFIQHGDRKFEQQALSCAGAVRVDAGEAYASADGAKSILREAPGATSCAQAAAFIADTGATFGGGGRTSNPVTAKMNLSHWRSRSVFMEANQDGNCHGRLTVSFDAHGGEANPIVSEEGRRFLLEQLQRLTPAHVRALFTAARVDKLGDRTTDEWVDVFQDKVQQIARQRCQPLAAGH
jgi:hypothetical protein